MSSVTVVIAASENEGLADTVNSVFDQAVRPQRIMIVDDGESWRSIQFLIGTAENAPVIATKRYDLEVVGVRAPPGNLASRLNIGTQMAYQETEFFGFTRSGDGWERDKIAKSLAAFELDPVIQAVVSDRYDGNRLAEYFAAYAGDRLAVHREYDINMFVRRAAFDRMKAVFDPTMGAREDYELLLRISEFGLIHHIPEPLHQIGHADDPEFEWEGHARDKRRERLGG